MTCTQCGSQTSGDAIFCQKCGSPITLKNPSEIISEPIWNPNAAANWSYIFTPVFGSYIQMSNWRTLGDVDKAASAKIWFYISILVLAALIGMYVFVPERSQLKGQSGGIATLYLLIWYFAAARNQVKFVKNKFGGNYIRKSWLKPLVIGVAGIFSLISISLASDYLTDKAAITEKTVTAGHDQALPISTVADCAAPDVKIRILEHFSENFVNSGVPDLISAIERNRMKFRLEVIRETSRNSVSKFTSCAGSIVTEMPKEDIDKEASAIYGMISGTSLNTVSTMAITYKVSISPDKEERKNGPIIEIKPVDAKEFDGFFNQVIYMYRLKAKAVPDITSNSKNTVMWEKSFRDSISAECAKQNDSRLCQCKNEQFEKIITADNMKRFGFLIQTGALDTQNHPNFVAFSKALDSQCPTTKSLASIFEPAQPSKPVQESQSLVESSSAEVVTAPTIEIKAESNKSPVSAPSSLQASFDCTKAFTKIEKLICSSAETANSDKRLAQAYSFARGKSDDQQKLKSDQANWMKQVRNVCSDATCLISVTDSRIQSLTQ